MLTLRVVRNRMLEHRVLGNFPRNFSHNSCFFRLPSMASLSRFENILCLYCGWMSTVMMMMMIQFNYIIIIIMMNVYWYKRFYSVVPWFGSWVVLNFIYIYQKPFEFYYWAEWKVARRPCSNLLTELTDIYFLRTTQTHNTRIDSTYIFRGAAYHRRCDSFHKYVDFIVCFWYTMWCVYLVFFRAQNAHKIFISKANAL